MKRILLIGLFTFLLKTTYGQEQLHLVHQPDEITVYLTAAEIKSQGSTSLREGITTINIKGIPSSMVPNSLQVALPPGVELLSVVTKDVTVTPQKIDRQLKVLWDSLDGVQQRYELVQNQIDAFQAEKEILKQNQKLGGNTTLSLVELNKAADFFRERTLKINTALSALTRKQQRIQAESDTLKQQYAERARLVNTTQKEIEIVLSSATTQKVTVTFRYLVEDAGWSAGYDLIAADVIKPIMLKYKAALYNNTGIDWNNVKVILSTGDPSLNASRPQLTAWTLNYSSTGNEGQLNFKNTNTKGYSNEAVEEEIAVSELSTTFPITKRQSIPSGAPPYWIELSSAELNATFEYLTVPKVDLSAFLIAKITGWEKLNLIDGDANIYFGNAYIGQSRLDTRAISDTLELSLGRDNQIIVSRSKLEDKGQTKLIGTKRSESFRYEISVKNNRSAAINIKIQDQIPVSQESDITVDAEEVSNATHDVLSGRLQWVKTVSPGQTLKLINAFTVKYPKGKQVTIRKQRMVKTPKYRH